MTRRDLGVAPSANASLIRKVDLDAIFPLGAGAWTAYTPTLTQSGTVTKTVDSARYTQVGKTITAQVYLTVTGSGTGGVGVLVGLPVTAKNASCSGNGWLLDTSAGRFYAGSTYMSPGFTTVGIMIGDAAGVTNIAGAAGFTAGLASGDIITMTFSYEVN